MTDSWSRKRPHKHVQQDIQGKANELDGTLLVLDSCGTDDNNPFLAQWVVHAL